MKKSHFKLLKILSILILFIFLVISFTLSAQENNTEGLKQSAQKHMSEGRYGEAIDLLNKYIAANPQEADGYNLRGLCYEKRAQYRSAVFDFRRASKLAPDDQEINTNLNRVVEIWHEQLRENIEGYKREIAINPAKPFNYLEVGKAYRHLEEWLKAEEWYDKYLERDDNASPDEIIRYSEILAKNDHIKKGEKILKEYVEKYPDDWRLRSRYGYFTLWLGKYKTAEDAFEKALSFKPYFKEAQDGLEMARQKGYVQKNQPVDVKTREYPIDRYYRILRKNPQNDEVRFKLVSQLVKADRLEEAYEQMQILGERHSGEERFEKKWEEVTELREQSYQKRIEDYLAELEGNPADKEAASKAAQYYSYLNRYDDAMKVLDNYFNAAPEEVGKEIRFQYAKVAAWNRYFEKAMEIIDDLLEDYPDNLDYQLFSAQLSVWTNQDMERAERYLNNVLEERPNNVDALISMGSLMLNKQNFEEAQKYADRAREIDPGSSEVTKLQSNIDFQKMRAKEEERYKILEKGRRMVLNDSCQQALQYYDQYLAEADPNILILKEYGDVHFCAKNYNEALDAYNKALEGGYYYDALLQKGKVYYNRGDSLKAIDIFKRVKEREPKDFQANLYLGDAFAKAEKYDSAQAIYDTLKTWDLDSNQVSMVEQRENWIIATGFGSLIATFPNYIGFAPSGAFYSDNLGFRFLNTGGRLELGATSFLGIGVSFYKTFLTGSNDAGTDISESFTTFKGHLYLRFDKVSAGLGMGSLNYGGVAARNVSDAFVRYEHSERFSLGLVYNNTDGALLLYSPTLVGRSATDRVTAELYRFEGEYEHTSGLFFSGYFQYISTNEASVNERFNNNEGNDFRLRIGKEFYENLFLGYEYFYSNYKYNLRDFEFTYGYYSPHNFESHSAWADWDIEKTEKWTARIGAKLGYVPVSSFVIRELNGQASYKPLESLTISAKMTLGSTYRFDSSYNYVSGELSAYWKL